jgi:iron complex outermembrane receptor protein
MNKLVKASLLLSSSIGIAMALPDAAWAQAAATPQATDNSGIEQVVVTAERRSELLQKVPISITVFNQQQLTNKNITNPSDLANYTPSLSTDVRFGADNASFAIRGFTQEIRTTPSVGTYFADVIEPTGGAHGTTAGDGASPGDLFDLQNVQVLKGPQGTLFGRNTTGGAVLIVPQKPTDEFGGYVEGSYGNYDLRRITGVINIPLNDTMRLRLGIDRNERGGYIHNISGTGPTHYGNVDYTAVRASFDWDVTSNLENYTIARFSRSDDKGTPESTFACNPAGALGSVLAGFCEPQLARDAGRGYWTIDTPFPNPKVMTEQWGIINETIWAASDNLTVKNIFSYSQFKSLYRGTIFGEDFITPNSLFGGIIDTSAYAGLPLTVTNTNTPPGSWTNNQATTTEELQFQGNAFSNKLIWQGGFYMQLSDPMSLTGTDSTNLAYCSNPYALQCTDIFGGALGGALKGGLQAGFGSIRSRDYAGYAQASYDLTDELKFTGGIRYTYDKTDGVSENVVYNFPTPNNPVARCPYGSTGSLPTCRVTNSQTSHAPTWLAELQYSPTDNQMYYAKYARGYRQGSVSPDSPPGLQVFGPEKVDTYEVGAKTSWDSAIPVVFDIAAFYNNFTNQQIQIGFEPDTNAGDQAGSNTTSIINAGQSRIWGVEADASVTPFKGLRLDIDYTYLDTLLQTLDFAGYRTLATNDGFTLVPTSVAGRPLPLSPKNKLSLTATYTLPLPESWGQASLGATYVHWSSQITSADPPVLDPVSGNFVGSPYGKLPMVDLVNFNFNWTAMFGSQFDGSVFVTNAFNHEYLTYVPGLFDGLGFEARSLGQPRMFGVRLRYNFGD